MTLQDHLHTSTAIPTPQVPSPRIKLPHGPRELSALVGKPNAITYRRLYTAVLNGDVPAEMERGRWTLCREDLPAIAATLGLTASAHPVQAQAA